MATLFPDSRAGGVRSPLDLTMLMLLEERLHDFSRQLADRIKEQRGQLATELLSTVAGSKLAHYDADPVQLAPGPAPDAASAEDALNSMSRAQIELRAVQEALKRIREGVYGWCKQCGEPIGHDRLLAQPYVCLCDGCQGKSRRAGNPVH